MVIILLLVLLMCLSSSSMYGFGFIPGTGSYVRKKLRPNNLSLKKLDESCMKIKSVEIGKGYFTLGGTKSIEELFSSDEVQKVEEIFDVCKKRDDGTLVTFDAFKDSIQGYDTVECDILKATMSDYQTKTILDDGKLISHVDAYEKIYPKSSGRCYEK